MLVVFIQINLLIFPKFYVKIKKNAVERMKLMENHNKTEAVKTPDDLIIETKPKKLKKMKYLKKKDVVVYWIMAILSIVLVIAYFKLWPSFSEENSGESSFSDTSSFMSE